jgi:hypothetical protein
MSYQQAVGPVHRHGSGQQKSPGYRPIPPEAVKPVKPRRRERVRRVRVKLG